MAPKTSPKLTFSQWMRAVDAACYDKVGCSYKDLDDYGYADAYAAGRSPKAVANAAIKAAGADW
jgi:hypothetical protein